jgi:hypothetical protein
MAPIISKISRTVYYPAPKSASSTLRDIFFEIENGYRFKSFVINDQEVNLFWLYGHGELFKRVEVPDGYEVFTVVRDPIERFVSFFKWGISDNHCRLDRPVGINDFVANLGSYLDSSPMIHFHVSPQFRFIGKDLSFYHRIFPMEELTELGHYLSERSQKQVTVGKTNPSSRQSKSNDLTPQSRAKLIDIYSDDYALLKDYYRP